MSNPKEDPKKLNEDKNYSQYLNDWAREQTTPSVAKFGNYNFELEDKPFIDVAPIVETIPGIGYAFKALDLDLGIGTTGAQASDKNLWAESVGLADTQRRNNQGFTEQALQTTINLPVNIELGLAEGVGMLGELGIYGFNELTGKDYQADFSNVLTEEVNKLKGDIQEASPILRENPNELIDFTDSAWWLQTGSSVIESVGSFAIGGAGIANITGKIGSGIGKIARLTGKSLANAKQVGQVIPSSILMAYTEGAVEAASVYDDILTGRVKSLEDAYYKGNLSAKEYYEGVEEAKIKASEGAATTAKVNTMLNAPLQMTGLKALATPSTQVLRKGIGALTKKQLAKNTYKAFAIETGGEALQEGLEELNNVFAGNLGRAIGKGKNPEWDELYKKTFLSEEGMFSMSLGALAGGVMGGVLNNPKAIRKEKELAAKVFEPLSKHKQLTRQISYMTRSEFEKEDRIHYTTLTKVSKHNRDNAVAAAAQKNLLHTVFGQGFDAWQRSNRVKVIDTQINELKQTIQNKEKEEYEDFTQAETNEAIKRLTDLQKLVKVGAKQKEESLVRDSPKVKDIIKANYNDLEVKDQRQIYNRAVNEKTDLAVSIKQTEQFLERTNELTTNIEEDLSNQYSSEVGNLFSNLVNDTNYKITKEDKKLTNYKKAVEAAEKVKETVSSVNNTREKLIETYNKPLWERVEEIKKEVTKNNISDTTSKTTEEQDVNTTAENIVSPDEKISDSKQTEEQKDTVPEIDYYAENPEAAEKANREAAKAAEADQALQEELSAEDALAAQAAEDQLAMEAAQEANSELTEEEQNQLFEDTDSSTFVNKQTVQESIETLPSQGTGKEIPLDQNTTEEKIDNRAQAVQESEEEVNAETRAVQESEEKISSSPIETDTKNLQQDQLAIAEQEPKKNKAPKKTTPTVILSNDLEDMNSDDQNVVENAFKRAAYKYKNNTEIYLDIGRNFYYINDPQLGEIILGKIISEDHLAGFREAIDKKEFIENTLLPDIYDPAILDDRRLVDQLTEHFYNVYRFKEAGYIKNGEQKIKVNLRAVLPGSPIRNNNTIKGNENLVFEEYEKVDYTQYEQLGIEGFVSSNNSLVSEEYGQVQLESYNFSNSLRTIKGKPEGTTANLVYPYGFQVYNVSGDPSTGLTTFSEATMQNHILTLLIPSKSKNEGSFDENQEYIPVTLIPRTYEALEKMEQDNPGIFKNAILDAVQIRAEYSGNIPAKTKQELNKLSEFLESPETSFSTAEELGKLLLENGFITNNSDQVNQLIKTFFYSKDKINSSQISSPEDFSNMLKFSGKKDNEGNPVPRNYNYDSDIVQRVANAKKSTVTENAKVLKRYLESPLAYNSGVGVIKYGDYTVTEINAQPILEVDVTDIQQIQQDPATTEKAKKECSKNGGESENSDSKTSNSGNKFKKAVEKSNIDDLTDLL